MSWAASLLLYAFNRDAPSTCNPCIPVDQPFALRLLVSVMSYEPRPRRSPLTTGRETSVGKSHSSREY